MDDGEDGIDHAELARRAEVRGALVEDVVTEEAGVFAARATEHPLDLYHTRGVITPGQYDAGKKFRRLHELILSVSIQCYDGIPPPESYGPRDISQRAVQAALDFDAITRRLGKMTTTVLVEFCCHGVGAQGSNKLRKGEEIGKIKLAMERLREVIHI